MTRSVRLTLVLLLTLLTQTMVVNPLAVFGARIDLWIVVTVAGGLATGPDRGAAIGFLCGAVFDMTHNGPIGLGALVYTVAGYLVGSVARSVVGPARWVPVLAAVATTIAAVTTYVTLGVMLGETQWVEVRLIVVLLVVTGGAALLTPPMVRIMGWTEGAPMGFSRPGRSSGRGRSSRRRSSPSPSLSPRSRA